MFASAPAEPWPAHIGAGYAIAARGRLRLAQGRVDDALEDFRAFAELARPWNLAGPGVVPWRADAATALLAAARREEARALILANLARARAYGAPGVLGRNLRVAGLAEGGTRRLELLNEAVGVLAGAPAELERARALVEYGAALRRGNQRTAARGVLDDGLRLAQRCGARPLAERAFDELRASGRRLRRSDLLAPDALTPSEHRVARLAASGMTNRNIARSLYLSPKTVEMHLSRVYRRARRRLPQRPTPAHFPTVFRRHKKPGVHQGAARSRARRVAGTLAIKPPPGAPPHPAPFHLSDPSRRAICIPHCAPRWSTRPWPSSAPATRSQSR